MVLQLTDGANLCANLMCLSIYSVPAKISAIEKLATHLGYIFVSKVDVECTPVLDQDCQLLQRLMLQMQL